MIGRFLTRQSPSQASPNVTPEIVDAMNKFNRQVILWGSDGVIREVATFRRMAQGGDEGRQVLALQKMGYVLLEMRRDLGHANKKISPREVLSLFVNDTDTIGEKWDLLERVRGSKGQGRKLSRSDKPPRTQAVIRT